MAKRRAVLILSLLIVSFSAVIAVRAAEIRISGSSTMVVLSQRLTDWYSGKHPGVSFHVEGGSPARGFSSLIEGNSEIAQSARQAVGGEVLSLRTHRKLEFVEIPIATEFAAIAVNASNPVRELSIYDLRQIFSGTVRNWKAVGGNDAPIHLFGRDNSSEVRSLVNEEILGDASFADSVNFLSTNAAVLSAVAADPNAVGYCNVDPHSQRAIRFVGVKVSVSGEAVEPTGDNIRAHRYKLSRTLYYYFAGRPTPELLAFAEWVLTPEGQLVVDAVGLYPLGQADREQARLRLTKLH